MSGSGSGGGAVGFVTATTGVIATSTTSQAHSMPATALVGDLAIAFIMHRDTLTPPSGWTLVRAQAVTAVGATQTLSVYKRVVQSGDPGASFTWTQATAQRMAVHYEVFRKAGGCDVTASASVSNASIDTIVNPMPMASLTVPAGSSMVCATVSQVGVTGSGSYSTTSLTLTMGGVAIPDNRLAAGYRSVTSGTLFSGSVSTSGGGSGNGYNGVTLSIG